jgi:hypothetical protein
MEDRSLHLVIREVREVSAREEGVCWKKLLGAERTAMSVRRVADGVEEGGVEREANTGGAKAGSPIGIKRGGSEMYFVFSVWWFFFFAPTTLYIATGICPSLESSPQP